MSNEPYQPIGYEFVDAASGRRMMLVSNDEPRESLRGWLLYWSKNYNNWVTLRKATDDDWAALTLTPRQCRKENS